MTTTTTLPPRALTFAINTIVNIPLEFVLQEEAISLEEGGPT
jgi:hypothetical protein